MPVVRPPEVSGLEFALADPVIHSDAVSLAVPTPLRALLNHDVVVTGASGMLGSYIVACLRHLSNLTKDKPRRIIAATSQTFRASCRSSVEVMTLAAAREIIPSLTTPIVIHAASPASPAGYVADPLGCMRVNVQVTEELALATGQADGTLIFVSSGEVYGPVPATPTSERDFSPFDPTEPRAVYAEAKRAGEAVALACHRTRGIDVRVARLFHTFGPGIKASDDRIFGVIAQAAFADHELRLRSEGEARRTFLYSLDALVGLSYLNHSMAPGAIANVSNGVCHSVRDVLGVTLSVRREMGHPRGESVPNATQDDSPISPTQESWADNSRLTSTGWLPQVALDDAIRRTLASVRWRGLSRGGAA